MWTQNQCREVSLHASFCFGHILLDLCLRNPSLHCQALNPAQPLASQPSYPLCCLSQMALGGAYFFDAASFPKTLVILDIVSWSFFPVLLCWAFVKTILYPHLPKTWAVMGKNIWICGQLDVAMASLWLWCFVNFPSISWHPGHCPNGLSWQYSLLHWGYTSQLLLFTKDGSGLPGWSWNWTGDCNSTALKIPLWFPLCPLCDLFSQSWGWDKFQSQSAHSCTLDTRFSLELRFVSEGTLVLWRY